MANRPGALEGPGTGADDGCGGSSSQTGEDMAGHFQGHNNNAAEVASAISGYQRGSGRLARKTLRQMYYAKHPKDKFSDAIKDLLKFEFNLFGKFEPLVVEIDKKEISLRLAEVVETLCKNFCCTQGQQRVLSHVVDQMLSTRGNSQ